jgi:hypothetical protein
MSAMNWQFGAQPGLPTGPSPRPRAIVGTRLRFEDGHLKLDDLASWTETQQP